MLLRRIERQSDPGGTVGSKYQCATAGYGPRQLAVAAMAARRIQEQEVVRLGAAHRVGIGRDPEVFAWGAQVRVVRRAHRHHRPVEAVESGEGVEDRWACGCADEGG